MKHYLPFVKRAIFVFCAALILQANNQLFCQQFESIYEPIPRPSIIIGAGLGINDNGFGFILEAPLSNQMSLTGNIGLGGWGWKLGGNLNYYFADVTRGSELSLGLSHATGLKDFETELTVAPNGTKQKVNLDLNSVTTLNLVYTYNIHIGKASKVAFSGGYAICLTENPYKVNSPVTLDETSKTVINILQPGGLILGVKIMIGSM